MASSPLEQISNRPADGTGFQPVQMLSFWAAVSLPFVNVALLTVGLDTPTKTAAFLSLLLLNLLALALGRTYQP
ncbi:hypothetical protein [Haloarchaeobius sp. HME9146]|uniref:hypothetical protein n=1 Tax=unclassified Haloarchaeobius TaxID=2614452 RepID=UPI0021C11881|nr:hypothetical protein [Haloarchaeobius sp. HME9146]MCT9097496.1 hypothetical protein [Haloarchaeobius sp. HME9146]